MRAILFDCDGTIADSCGLICETMRRVFVASGLAEPADSATRGVIGLSLGEAIGRLHPVGDADAIGAMTQNYRTSFRAIRQEMGFAETLFAGMRPLLKKLQSRDDVLLGMVTGKSRRGVHSICEAHGLEGMFLAVRTADDCPSKPHPAMVLEACAELGVEPFDTLVVGDAIFDIQMARAAGAEAFGVSWGTNEARALLAAGAGAVAETVDELESLIDGWLADVDAIQRRHPSPVFVAG